MKRCYIYSPKLNVAIHELNGLIDIYESMDIGVRKRLGPCIVEFDNNELWVVYSDVAEFRGCRWDKLWLDYERLLYKDYNHLLTLASKHGLDTCTIKFFNKY